MNYNNIFEMPIIPDEQIIALDENNKETLILKLPIVAKGKIKYAYFKPPSFLKHYEFQKELTVLQLYVLEKHKLIESLQDGQDIDLKASFTQMLGFFQHEEKLVMKLIKKYLHFRTGKKSASFRWFVKNANLMQIQKVFAYVLLLPETIKKNERFLNQKLNILRHSQTLKAQSGKSAGGEKGCLKPRY